MSAYTGIDPIVSTAAACVQRCDHGAGTPLTFAQCREQVEHSLDKCNASALKDIIAYLSAQIVGYQHRADQNAPLALHQIGRIVREYEERTK